MSFLPNASFATFAHQAVLGRGGARRKKRRKKARAARPAKRKTRSGTRKPKPGTKAWMTYIRGKRGKKKR